MLNYKLVDERNMDISRPLVNKHYELKVKVDDLVFEFVARGIYKLKNEVILNLEELKSFTEKYSTIAFLG